MTQRSSHLKGNGSGYWSGGCRNQACNHLLYSQALYQLSSSCCRLTEPCFRKSMNQVSGKHGQTKTLGVNYLWGYTTSVLLKWTCLLNDWDELFVPTVLKIHFCCTLGLVKLGIFGNLCCNKIARQVAKKIIN